MKSSFKQIKAPGPRFRVGPRGFVKPQSSVPPNVVLPNGKKLNTEESIVHRALERRKGLNFEAQAKIGGNGNRNGQVDWALWDYGIALEYQGIKVGHFTEVGVAKDFLREVARKEAGLDPVYIYKGDLPNIDQVLDRILAAPQVAAIMRG